MKRKKPRTFRTLIYRPILKLKQPRKTKAVTSDSPLPDPVAHIESSIERHTERIRKECAKIRAMIEGRIKQRTAEHAKRKSNKPLLQLAKTVEYQEGGGSIRTVSGGGGPGTGRRK